MRRLVYVVLLTVVFVALDIVGTIDWSVWWLVSPVWVDIVISGFLALMRAGRAASASKAAERAATASRVQP